MENIRLEVERDVFVTTILGYTRQAPFYFWFEYTDSYYGHHPEMDEMEDNRAVDLGFRFKFRKKQDEIQNHCR